MLADFNSKVADEDAMLLAVPWGTTDNATPLGGDLALEIYPVVAGTGARLLKEGSPPKRLNGLADRSRAPARQRLKTSRSVLPPTRTSGNRPRRRAPALSASRP